MTTIPAIEEHKFSLTEVEPHLATLTRSLNNAATFASDRLIVELDALERQLAQYRVALMDENESYTALYHLGGTPGYSGTLQARVSDVVARSATALALIDQMRLVKALANQS